MHHYASAAPNQTVERKAFSSQFQRRLAICLVQTVVNAIIVGRFAGTIYLSTMHHAFQQVGVILMLVAMIGSLVRMWVLTLRDG